MFGFLRKVAIVLEDFTVIGRSFRILGTATEKALAQVEFSFRNKTLL